MDRQQISQCWYNFEIENFISVLLRHKYIRNVVHLKLIQILSITPVVKCAGDWVQVMLQRAIEAE